MMFPFARHHDWRGTPVAQDIIVFIDVKANNYVARDVEEAHGDEMEVITW